MFGIMAGKYRWNRDKFGSIVDFCFSLANFHIRLHPLREQDFEYYQKVLADLKRRTEEQSTMVKKRQQKHRARQARMKAVMENLDEDVGSMFGGASTEDAEYLEESLVSQCLLGEMEEEVDESKTSSEEEEEDDKEEEDNKEEEEEEEEEEDEEEDKDKVTSNVFEKYSPTRHPVD